MEVTKKPLVVSVSPHIKSDETTSRIMWTVSAALLPATVMGAYYFGPRAVISERFSAVEWQNDCPAVRAAQSALDTRCFRRWMRADDAAHPAAQSDRRGAPDP